MSKKIELSVKNAVLQDYADGKKSVWQICSEYNVAYRTVYKWVNDAEIPNRTGSNRRKTERCGLSLSHEEVNILLLAILEFENICPEKDRYALSYVQDRLCFLSDKLEGKIANTEYYRPVKPYDAESLVRQEN